MQIAISHEANNIECSKYIEQKKKYKSTFEEYSHPVDKSPLISDDNEISVLHSASSHRRWDVESVSSKKCACHSNNTPDFEPLTNILEKITNSTINTITSALQRRPLIRLCKCTHHHLHCQYNNQLIRLQLYSLYLHLQSSLIPILVQIQIAQQLPEKTLNLIKLPRYQRIQSML